MVLEGLGDDVLDLFELAVGLADKTLKERKMLFLHFIKNIVHNCIFS